MPTPEPQCVGSSWLVFCDSVTVTYPVPVHTSAVTNPLPATAIKGRGVNSMTDYGW